MNSRLTRRIAAGGFAAALILGGAACGDDDEDVATDVGQYPQGTTTTAGPPAR